MRMRYATLVFAAGLTISSPLSAQTTARRSGEQIQAAFNAHKGDFDYLLGDWEFTVTNPQYGTSRGYWSAVRLADGQIVDEYRVVGDSGQTDYVTTTVRNYNGAADRWELIRAAAGTGLPDFGTSHQNGDEVRIEQTFGGAARTA